MATTTVRTGNTTPGQGPRVPAAGTQDNGARHTIGGILHPPQAVKPVQTQPVPAQDTSIPAAAAAILGQFLDEFGLSDMTNWAWNRYKELGGGQDAMNILRFEITQQPQFKARYPAYEAMQKQGNAWTVAQIQSYEQQAKDLLHMVGLDTQYGPEKLQDFIVKGVSYNELAQRVQMAQTAAQSPHYLFDSLKSMYGVSQDHLAGFLLDPDAMESKITQQFQAAQIGGQALQAGYGQISAAEGEQLAAEGVNQSQAQQGFGQLVTGAGLIQAQVAGEQQIGRQTQLGVVAGDLTAQQAFQDRQRARQAAFGGAGGFGVSNKGVTGLGQNG